MPISLIMQIAQSMPISIRHFMTPQTMYTTFPSENLAVKNISGLVCLAIIMAGVAVFYVAGYLIEERRRWLVITASPRTQCSKSIQNNYF